MKLRYLFLIAMGAFLIYSCEPEIEEYNYTSGSADFSNYVSLGNSLTSGYADGALYKESQENSYPAILADQMKKVGGGDFSQPLMPNDMGVGFDLTPQGPVLRTKLVVGYATDCLGNTSLSPVPADPNPDQGALMADLMTPIAGPFNNMAVPGAKSFHLVAPGYGNSAGVAQGLANPYFARFASSPTTTVLADAAAQTPTFFSLWIGSNDALGYAYGGGVGDTLTGQQFFGFIVGAVIQTMQSQGAKGAIANVPDIASSPFFTTIPPNGYVLNQDQADLLNQFLGGFGFEFQAGPNYFIIEDTTTQLGFRQMTAGEHLILTLPQDSLKCAYWGGFNPELQIPVPIPDKYVLDAEEVNEVQTAIDGYNQTIAMLAENYGLAHVDINGFLKQAAMGVSSDGETLSNSFITGNAFSTDGLHLTPKGNAQVANLFIEAINKKFGSTIPMVSTTAYRANLLP